MKKQVQGQILWGAGDTIHTIGINATVNTDTQVVESLKFEMENQFFDDVLQNVFEAGSQEALRLAND